MSSRSNIMKERLLRREPALACAQTWRQLPRCESLTFSAGRLPSFSQWADVRRILRTARDEAHRHELRGCRELPLSPKWPTDACPVSR